MPHISSPLRYPGGKARLARLLGDIISLNKLEDGTYVEPYAGGAGAALNLLFSERVSRIIINDVDVRIYALWKAMLTQTNWFLDLLATTPVTIDEWQKQRDVYDRPSRNSNIRLGFATFFLNRCNRSGILVNGGPIGGYGQRGRWKLNARFNRTTLRSRIERIALYRDRIEIHNKDALSLMRRVVQPLSRKEDVFVYLDPPYYHKGPKLYFNIYEHRDHVRLAQYLSQRHHYKWIVSYDNVPEINTIYKKFTRVPFDLTYSAYEQRIGQELLIHDRRLRVPRHRDITLCAG